MATIIVRKKVLQGTRELVFIYAECGGQKYHKRLKALSHAPVELEVPAGEYKVYVKSPMLPPMSNIDTIVLTENDRVSYEVAIGYRFFMMLIIMLLFIVGMPFVQRFFSSIWFVYMFLGIVLTLSYVLYIFTIGNKKVFKLERDEIV